MKSDLVLEYWSWLDPWVVLVLLDLSLNRFSSSRLTLAVHLSGIVSIQGGGGISSEIRLFQGCIFYSKIISTPFYWTHLFPEVMYTTIILWFYSGWGVPCNSWNYIPLKYKMKNTFWKKVKGLKQIAFLFVKAFFINMKILYFQKKIYFSKSLIWWNVYSYDRLDRWLGQTAHEQNLKRKIIYLYIHISCLDKL